MTAEAKMRRLFEDYDDAKCALKNEYEDRFSNVSVNEFGEADAREVLELNMWYVEKENALLRLFAENATRIGKEG